MTASDQKHSFRRRAARIQAPLEPRSREIAQSDRYRSALKSASHNVPAKSFCDPSEQRFAKRRATKTRAVIVQPNNENQINCTVRDVSSTGALIHLPVESSSVSRAGDYVNPRFVLRMPTEKVEVDCEMAWRQGYKIGVRFVGPSRMIPAPTRRQTVQDANKSAPRASGLVGRVFAR